MHYEKFADGTVICIEDEIPFDEPDGWSWVLLGDIGQYKKGPFGSSITKAMFVPDSPTAIKIYEQKNAINKDASLGTYFISEEKYQSLRGFEVFPNDIIVSCAGTIGETYVLPNGMRKGIINQALMKISLYDLGMLEFYLVYFDFQLKASTQEHGHGIALKNIPPFDVLKKYFMPVPPLQEQRRIIKELTSILQFLNAIDADRADISSLIARTKAKVLDLAIRGQLVPQNPDDEPAFVLLERIRTEKEALIKAGRIKRDKRESVIFRGVDNSYYEKVGNQQVCIDDDLPYSLPEGWIWCELQDCCLKEIRRGRSPKYAEKGHVLSFAQKCNQKTGDINMGLALWIDDSTTGRYEDDEYMRDGDIVINSTGTGTLGRVGIYRSTDNPAGMPVVSDSHVTVVRVSSHLDPLYFYYCLKSMQSRLETLGEGSTNQKELKPLTVQQLRMPMPPIAEQKQIVKQIIALFSHLDAVAKSLT